MNPVAPIPRPPRSRLVVLAAENVRADRLTTGLLRRPPTASAALEGRGTINATLT